MPLGAGLVGSFSGVLIVMYSRAIRRVPMLSSKSSSTSRQCCLAWQHLPVLSAERSSSFSSLLLAACEPGRAAGVAEQAVRHARDGERDDG